MSAHSIVVLKFGSSVLTGPEQFPVVVHEIYRHLRQGQRVVAVVSALDGRTGELLALARAVTENPAPNDLAGLLGHGESQSALLLGMALHRAGIDAITLGPRELSLLAEGDALDADPVSLDAGALRRALEEHTVVVVPGFVAIGREGRSMVLGRGGSDLSALFIAQSLEQAPCRLIKDVDGIYTSDPALPGKAPARFSQITWRDAIELAGPLVQRKALLYAEAYCLRFDVAGAGLSHATCVGPGPSRQARQHPPGHRLRVALLGAGTVGYGVYRHLVADPERFEVVGIAVSDLDKARPPDLPPELLTDDPWTLVDRPAEVVVELIGDEQLALGLMRAALEAGRHLVTANKAVVAESGQGLRSLAESHGARVAWSASVGGSLPAVELVRLAQRNGTVLGVEGVLNGTCNFILDRLGENCSFEEALAEAQVRGFAEADPTRDLSGQDAASKLKILAHAAFGAELTDDGLERIGIEHLGHDAVCGQRSQALMPRLVVECSRANGQVRARVAPRLLCASHPLAKVRGEWNQIRIQVEGGDDIVARGKGAGCWPTAESVFADLMDIWRA